MLLQLPLDDLTELIIAKGMVVHDYFGPGVFETVYKRCVGLLLVEAGLIVEIEKSLPVRFRSLSIDCGYRVDLLVENKVVVEVKAVDALVSIHIAQMMTYLRLTNCPVNKRCLEPLQGSSSQVVTQASEVREDEPPLSSASSV